MLTITKATPDQINIIQEIAYATWPETFGSILSKEQIAYMLGMMYDDASLRSQITDRGHIFLLANVDGVFGGFASYELNYKGELKAKLHKIYIRPDMQGKSVGKVLMTEVAGIARKAGMQYLTLNVNRENNAVGFYQRYGFQKIGEEDIDIGNGYFMNDAIMQMTL